MSIISTGISFIWRLLREMLGGDLGGRAGAMKSCTPRTARCVGCRVHRKKGSLTTDLKPIAQPSGHFRHFATTAPFFLLHFCVPQLSTKQNPRTNALGFLCISSKLKPNLKHTSELRSTIPTVRLQTHPRQE